jgi:DNA-directed RNA polymerase subunit L
MVACHITHKPKKMLRFQLKNVDKSVANALRRTILGRIKTVVLKAVDCEVTVNTSRVHNEILKERLACLPVFCQDFEAAAQCELVLSKKNDGEEILVVTTKDFVVMDGDKVVEGFFPPTKVSAFGVNYLTYPEILPLRPASSKLPAEEIHLKCKFSVGTAAESGQYNVASTCSYGFTQDKEASDAEFEKNHRAEDRANWELLEAKRFVVPDSYDFVVETLGVYTNEQLVQKACDVLVADLQAVVSVSTDGPSDTSIENCRDVTIKGGDFSVGKLLEYQLYHFKDDVAYVVFLKKHPHDADGILRVVSKTPALQLIDKAAAILVTTFKKLRASLVPTPAVLKAIQSFRAQPVVEKRMRLLELNKTEKKFDDEVIETAGVDELDRMGENYILENA